LLSPAGRLGDRWLVDRAARDDDDVAAIAFNGAAAANHLTARHLLGHIGCEPHLWPQNAYFGKRIPIAGTGHQNGTIRFGRDPRTSALDTNCRAHELDNLCVVDGSFFPSSAAVNPTLTIIANALRVSEHVLERLGARSGER
jgi:choline dehydrogenase-like flavoprotein